MSLKQKAKAAADPNSEQSVSRQLGDLERKLTAERSKNQGLTSALKRAQEESRSVGERLDLLLDTNDKIHVSKLSKIAKKKPTSPATAILCCNDWHAEERIDSDQVGGMNEFNLDIAAKRIQRVWDKAIYLLDFSRHVSNIDDLVLWLGGDLVNGIIAEEMAEHNTLGPTEAIVWIQDQVAAGLRQLTPHFKSITVVTSGGNHGRSTKKTRIGTWWRHSWEWLAYKNLAKYFASEPKVTFKIEQSYHNWLNIQGYDVRFHHGDAITYAGGVGGASVPIRKKCAQWNKIKRASFDVIGHFHTHLVDWNYVMCGCLVGINPYAISIAADFQPPTQTWMVVDKSHGRVITLPIFVEEAR